MANVLFLNHFEDIWEDEIRKYGSSLEEEVEKVLDFIENTEIDKVIVTNFDTDDVDSDLYQSRVRECCRSNGILFESHIYAYGFRKEEDYEHNSYPDEKKGIDWCQGTRSHHTELDVLEIEEFHRDLKRVNNVYLAGAFDGQCVLYTETVFNEIGVNYEKVEGLVVGDGCIYEFKSEKLSEFVERIIEKYEAKMETLSIEEECYKDFNSLILNNPDAVEDILDELKEELEERSENLESTPEFHVSTSFHEFSEILEGVFRNDDENYDLILERIEEAKLIKDNTKELEEKEYYHGTTWKKPTSEDDTDFCHEFVDIDYNDNGATYFSDVEDVADAWGNKAQDEEIAIVFKLNMELKKVYVHSDMSTEISAFDQELTLNDREELYSSFNQEGYDAFIMESHYPEFGHGDDIAYFDSIDESDISSAKAYINNKWTDYMEVDELKELVVKEYLKNKVKNRATMKNR